MRLPPQPLNQEQRQRVLAMLAHGATRRMATKYAGCRVLDLTAEMQCDPDYKQQVQQHELRPEIEVLRALLVTARDPKQWRAAAWVLERFYPRRYAPRKADALRRAELQAALNSMEQQSAEAAADPKKGRQFLAHLQRQRSPPAKPRPTKRRRSKPEEG